MDGYTCDELCKRQSGLLTRRNFLRLSGFGLAGAALLGATGCGGERRGVGDRGEGGGSAQRGGTLVFGVDAIQGNFDPGIFATFGDWMAIDCIARGLTHIDYRSTEPQPALAESWKISDDGRVYTFRLRDGVTFHDGNPLTAEDCRRSFLRLMDENDPSRPEGTYAIAELGGENVKEVRAVDERTFEITLGEPDVAFLARLSNPNGVILSAAAIDKYGDRIGNNLVGAGPFKLVDAQAGQKVTLEAFEDYWEGRPPLDRVVLQVLPDPQALTSALQSGQVQASNFLPYSSVDRLKNSGNLRLYEPKPYIDIFIEMNVSVPLLSDLRVRQAINYAIDRKSIIDEAFAGLAKEPAYMVSPPELGYDESLEKYSTQDMDRARKLLKEARAEGERVSLLSQNILFWPKVGQIVTSNLEELGLKVEAQYLDSGTLASRKADPKAHELFTEQRSAFVPDPDNKLSPLLASDSFVAQNFTVSHKLPIQKEIDRRLVEARQETDPQKRAQMYVSLQRLLAEKQMVRAMVAYIFTPTATTLDVTGFNADALGTYRLFLEKTGFSG
ncbi:ABC transporter substrate-binding protein [Rubrobacter xylanophilus]|uniref:ABC transporter substrate-binding protein n=1 Tax=Rubrobacter xylanophilus TaxID=49319 RepID=UPI0002F3A38F|nr:ABC transporter substrate-binding protein [Rubrobacter xylanophilus]